MIGNDIADGIAKKAKYSNKKVKLNMENHEYHFLKHNSEIILVDHRKYMMEQAN